MVKAVIFDMYETLITHYQCPLYFSAQMAADIGISEAQFRALWNPLESDRSIGKLTLEEALEIVLKGNQCYSEELLQKLAGKRVATKEECFRHLHPEIIPMLSGLKEKGILIGLISNCFSEEAKVIRKSELFPYFDVPCLSYEMGMQKPDEAIFYSCMDSLGVKAGECLYVGDGGSRELETAEKLGMTALQAVWYFREGSTQPVGRKPEFVQLESPLDVLGHVEA